MTSSYVVLSHPSAGPTRLGPGDLVGRLWSAALRIEHPNVSEVHAYVSLRDGVLKLLSLRGGLGMAGRMQREIALAPGQEIQLAHGQVLTVVEVNNPSTLLALVGPDGAAEVLLGRAVSLLAGAGRVPRIVPDAAVTLWTDGAGWVAKAGDAPPRTLAAGDELVAGDDRYRVVALSVAGDGTPGTVAGARLDAPLRIEGWFDTAHLHREGAPCLVLTGAAARLVCELGAIAQPVAWAEVARVLWPEEQDAERLRKRWDVVLVRLRRKLVQEAVRSDLVHPDGAGNVKLLLGPGDVFVDRS